MIGVSMAKTTKEVSLDKETVDALSEQDLKEAQQAVDLVNTLARDLVQNDCNIPPHPAKASESTSTLIRKMIANASKFLQEKPPRAKEAIQALGVALESSSRRALWEPIGTTIEETGLILGLRCDAYVVSQQWPEAWADAKMSGILFAHDPKASFRKGMILSQVGRLEEAKTEFEQARDMNPNEHIYHIKLAEVEKAIAQRNVQTSPSADEKNEEDSS